MLLHSNPFSYLNDNYLYLISFHNVIPIVSALIDQRQGPFFGLNIGFQLIEVSEQFIFINIAT